MNNLVPDYPSKKENKKMIKDSQGKEIIDFWNYMYKTVKITLKCGKTYIGYPFAFSTWADSQSGDDEVSIKCEDGFSYALERNDIKTIEEIPED